MALEADQFYASDDWKNADAPTRQKYLDRTAEVFDEAFASAESSLDAAEADSFYNSTTAFLQGKMAEHNSRDADEKRRRAAADKSMQVFTERQKVTPEQVSGVVKRSLEVAGGMSAQTRGSGVMKLDGEQGKPSIGVQPLDWTPSAEEFWKDRYDLTASQAEKLSARDFARSKGKEPLANDLLYRSEVAGEERAKLDARDYAFSKGEDAAGVAAAEREATIAYRRNAKLAELESTQSSAGNPKGRKLPFRVVRTNGMLNIEPEEGKAEETMLAAERMGLLTSEEAARLIPSGVEMDKEFASRPKAQGGLVTAVKEFGSAILPALGTAAGTAIGAAASKGDVSTAMVGGASGGSAALWLQNKVFGQVDQAQREANARAHPGWAQVGSFVPFLVSMFQKTPPALTTVGKMAQTAKVSLEPGTAAARWESALQSGVAMGRAGFSSGVQQRYVEGNKDVNPIDEGVRSFIAGGAMGILKPAKGILMAMTGKAVKDAAAVTFAEGLYDLAVHNKPIDFKAIADEAPGTFTAFALQNAVMGVFHKFQHRREMAKMAGKSAAAANTAAAEAAEAQAKRFRKDGFIESAIASEALAETHRRAAKQDEKAATEQYWQDVAKAQKRAVEHTQANEGPLTERAAYGRTGDVYDAFGNVQRKPPADGGGPGVTFQGQPLARAQSDAGLVSAEGAQDAKTPLYDAFGNVQRKVGEPKNEKAQSVPSVQKADESVRLPQKEVAPAAPSPEPVTPAAAKPVNHLSLLPNLSDKEIAALSPEQRRERMVILNAAVVYQKHLLSQIEEWPRKDWTNEQHRSHATFVTKLNEANNALADMRNNPPPAKIDLTESQKLKIGKAQAVPVRSGEFPQPGYTEQQPAAAPQAAKPVEQMTPEEYFTNELKRRSVVTLLPIKDVIANDPKPSDSAARKSWAEKLTQKLASAISDRSDIPADWLSNYPLNREDVLALGYLKQGDKYVFRAGKKGVDVTPNIFKLSPQKYYETLSLDELKALREKGDTSRERGFIEDIRQRDMDALTERTRTAALSEQIQAVKTAIANERPVSVALAKAIEMPMETTGWTQRGDLWHPPEAKPTPQAPAKTQRAMSNSEIEGVRKAQMPVIEDATSGIKERYESALGKKLTGDQVFDIAVKITKGIHQKGGRANIQDILDSARKDQIISANAAAATAPAAAPAVPQAEGGIFGYSWADIRSKQQGGTLAALIRGNAPKATESDFAVLEKHGMDWLYDNVKVGIIDRLGLPVDRPSRKAVEAKPPAQSFTEKVRAKIVPGAKVSVQLVRGAKLAHPAIVRDVFLDSKGKPESVSVTFDGGKKKGITQTVPYGNVSLRPGVESRMLTNEQFEGMTKEEARKTRAAAAEFKKLVIEYPELGFYSGHLEAVAAGAQGEAAIKKARADAYVEAMIALGVHPDKADARDAVTQASLVEKMRELTKKPGMERKQYADFQEAKEEGDGEIKAGDLKYGKTINIGGEEMRVIDIDKDGVVTLQDGEKFGTQEVHPDESLMIKGEAPELAPTAPVAAKPETPTINVLKYNDSTKITGTADGGLYATVRTIKRKSGQMAYEVKGYSKAEGQHPDLEQTYEARGEQEAIDAAKEIARREIAKQTPEPATPKLRPSDGKGTGELLQGEAAPFNLVAETAADIAKREAREAAEQVAKEAKDAAEAKAKQDKEQGNLFDEDPFAIADAAPTTSLPVASVQRAVRVVAERLAGAMPHEVIADGSAFPDRVKEVFLERYGASGDLNRIRGAVVGGKIYINAAAIENPRQAIETFMHEAAGHGGVDALLQAFGEKATTQLDAMLKRLFPDEHAAVKRSYPSREQVSETLAKIMEGVGPEMSAQHRTRWQRVVDWLRNALNKLGVKQWSKNDVMALLRRGVDAVRKQRARAADVNTLSGSELTYAAREAGVVLTPEQTMYVINRDPAVTADVRARVSEARGDGPKMSAKDEQVPPDIQAVREKLYTEQQKRAGRSFTPTAPSVRYPTEAELRPTSETLKMGELQRKKVENLKAGDVVNYADAERTVSSVRKQENGASYWVDFTDGNSVKFSHGIELPIRKTGTLRDEARKGIRKTQGSEAAPEAGALSGEIEQGLSIVSDEDTGNLRFRSGAESMGARQGDVSDRTGGGSESPEAEQAGSRRAKPDYRKDRQTWRARPIGVDSFATASDYIQWVQGGRLIDRAGNPIRPDTSDIRFSLKDENPEATSTTKKAVMDKEREVAMLQGSADKLLQDIRKSGRPPTVEEMQQIAAIDSLIAKRQAEIQAEASNVAQGATPPEINIADPNAEPPDREETGESGPRTYGGKFDSMDAQRAERGLPPLARRFRKANRVLWDAAVKRFETEPKWADRLVDEISSGEKTVLTDEEFAGVFAQQIDLHNKRQEAADRARDPNLSEEEQRDALDQFQYYEKKLQASEILKGMAGSEAGAALQSLKLMANEDFSLAAMEARERKAKQSSLTLEEVDRIRDEATRIAKAQADLDARKAATEAAERIANAEAKIAEWSKIPSRVLEYAKQKVNEWVSAGNAASERLRARAGQVNVGVDPTILGDIFLFARGKIAQGMESFGNFAASTASEFGEWVRPYLKPAWDKAMKYLNTNQPGRKVSSKQKARQQAATKDAASIEDGIRAMAEEGLPDDMGRYVKQLANEYVKSGATTVKGVMARLHAFLDPVMGNPTDDVLLDLWTDYGKGKAATEDALKRLQSQIRQEALIVRQIIDAEAALVRSQAGEDVGDYLKLTGQQRVPVRDQARALAQQLNELKKKIPPPQGTAESRRQSALDALEKRTRNRIKDLRFEIAKGERTIKNRGVTPTSPNLEALRAELATVEAEHLAVFGRREATPEQKLKSAIKSAERAEQKALAELEAAKRGVFTRPVQKGAETRNEVLVIRARADAARAETQALKELASPPLSDAQKRLDAALVARERWEQMLAGEQQPTSRQPQESLTQLEEDARMEIAAMRELAAQIRRDAKPATDPDDAKVRALEAAAAEYERRVNESDFTAKSKTTTVDSARVAQARALRDAALAAYNAAKNAAGVTEQTKIANRKAAMLRQIADLTDRLAKSDFEKRPPRPPVDLSKDPEAVRIASDLQEIKSNYAKRLLHYIKERRGGYEKFTDAMWTAITAERSLMGSGDLSAPRQGIRMAYSHPIMAAKAIWRSIRTIFSQKQAVSYEAERKLRPNYALYKPMKIQMPSVEAEAHDRMAEEGVRSNIEDWADIKLSGNPLLVLPKLVPKLLGHYVRASSRTFTTFLNELAADVADYRINELRDKPMSKIEKEALGDMINSGRGRGLKAGAGKLAQFVFYSANFLAARAKNLSGYHIWRRNSSMRIRKIALKEQFRAIAGWMVVSAISRYFYGDTGDDEDMFDKAKRLFKMKVTDSDARMEYDYTGGEVKLARIGAALIEGISTTIHAMRSGQEEADKQRAFKSYATIGREIRSISAPWVGVATDLFTGSNYDGKVPTVPSIARDLTVPLAWRSADEFFERAGFAKTVVAKLQEAIGVGVSVTRDKTAPKERRYSR